MYLIEAILNQFEPHIESFKSERLIALLRTELSPDMADSLQYFNESFSYNDETGKSDTFHFNNGYDESFDDAQAKVDEIEKKLKEYLIKCRDIVRCSSINYKDIGKEIYQLEVPVKTKVPAEWTSMSKTQRYVN